MRVATALVCVAFLVSACDSESSTRANAPTTTTARSCLFQVASTGAGDSIEWPADGRDCVSGLIEEQFKGTQTAIRCGSLHPDRGSCEATWTDSNGADCNAEFKLHVYGPYVDISDGVPIMCTIS